MLERNQRPILHLSLRCVVYPTHFDKALLFLLLLLWLGADAAVSGKSKPAATTQPTPPPVTVEVIVSEMPATVYLPTSTSGETHTITFFVRSRTPAMLEVQITSAGLGGAMFRTNAGSAPVAGSMPNTPNSFASQYCPAVTGKLTPCLTLPRLDQHGMHLQVELPVQLVPQPGNSVAGKILMFAAGQKPLEVPLTLQRLAPELTWTYVQWGLGIFVPALLSFLFGYSSGKFNLWNTERREQLNRLRSFKDEKFTELNVFFGTYYGNLYKDEGPTTFVSTMYKKLAEQNYLPQIPLRERRKLERARRKNKLESFKKTLAKVFPEWEQAIKHPTAGNDGQ